MNYLNTLLLGFVVAFLGLLPPGMINMTALKVSMEAGRRDALFFILGATVINVVEAFIAVTFIQFLVRHPQIIDYLNYGAIAIFLGLAIFFFYHAHHADQELVADERLSNPFLAGLVVSAMNLMTVPYFVGAGAILKTQGWLQVDAPHNYLFGLGAMVGVFLLFFLYIWFADFIQRRVKFISRNINYILSVVFVALAVLAVLNVVE